MWNEISSENDLMTFIDEVDFFMTVAQKKSII